MLLSEGGSSSFSMLSKSSKVVALETNLQQCFVDFRELIGDLESLQIDFNNLKSQYFNLIERCDSKTCSAAEQLQKEITKRDEIIQSVASLLTKLNETHDMNIINIAFKVLCQESTPLTPPEENSKDSSESKDLNSLKASNATKDSNVNKDSNAIKDSNATKLTPKKPDTSITEDVSFKEESLCEIEGTPTGRQSPIIQSKKPKNNLGKSTDFREKKKLPDEWSKESLPAAKAMTLAFHSPIGRKGKWTQSKLNLVKAKPSIVVDLTCSPEPGKIKQECNVQPLIKKESIENDDTILPSPTSGPANFNFKESPAKWKKPGLSLVKSEKVSPNQDDGRDIKEMEESINILNRIPDRLKVNIKTETPTYTEPAPMDEDATRCDTECVLSLSLLDRANKHETQVNGRHISPLKHPLQENINIMNTPPKQEPDTSVSLLRPTDKLNIENCKRKLIEPIYKEPTVRKKAEKRDLQGWSCDECKNFYGVLYKDDPVMLARKIQECSRHRGRHNPQRPRTPDGYWNPRWEVPADTDDLNRMNDAV